MTEAARKAAVLFRSLDPESAAVLLAQLSPTEARAVRDAVRSLGEVSDEDRQRVALELSHQKKAPHDSSAESQAVELAIAQPPVEDMNDAEPSRSSSAEGLEGLLVDQPNVLQQEASIAPAFESPMRPHASSRRGAFASLTQLEQTDPATLAAYLDRENAGVVAVVLSYLSPQRAAAVLDELHFDQRTDAIARLAQLGEGDPETLDVLAADLAAWITQRQEEQSRQADRLATIEAILGAASPSSRSDLVQGLRQRGCEWAGSLDTSEIEGRAEPQFKANQPPINPLPVEHPVAVTNTAATVEGFSSEVTSVAAEKSQAIASPLVSATLSVPFAEVEKLNPRLLAEVVRRTPPRRMLLALAGATESLQRRIESLVPKKQARELRRRVDSLGPASLREIDDAQQAVAAAASELWDYFYGQQVA